MAYLEVIKGDIKGRIIRFDSQLTIGRSTDNKLCLSDTSVSRQHCIITEKENYFTISDLGSANGTLVNKNSLHRHVPHPLYDGDEIVIGDYTFIFKSEGKDPISAKKRSALQHTARFDSISSKVSGLTMVFTSETHVPSVCMTIDASKHSFDIQEKTSNNELMQTLKRLESVVKVSQDIGTLEKPAILLEKIMNSIFDIFPHADRAFIMLKDKKSNEFLPVLGRSRNSSSKEKEFPVSKTIIKEVIEKKQSILSSDAQQDNRFASQQSIVNLSIRSLMCVPFLCKDELLGIISVDTMSAQHAFSKEDLSMLTSIAGQAAIAIKNAELYAVIEKETQLRTQLSRYLSPDVVEGVIKGNISLKLGGERKNGTILFCDIVGFTSMAECLPAVLVVELLNKYFSIITEIISKNHGTLHKFGGDMIMAFWNVLFPDEKAKENSIIAGLEIQNAVWKFSCELESSNKKPIYVGIGCNTGEFAGGNIGGEERMEYTVIGDNVNLAQRIESLASRWQVFISESTLEGISYKCSAIELPTINVKGKSSPVKIFSIRAIEDKSNQMLLNIPSEIFIESQKICDGFLSRFFINTQTLHILIPANINLNSANNICSIKFNLPELSKDIILEGKIYAFENCEKEFSNSKILILNELEGEDAILFLSPNYLISSNKKWEEMERH